jgi:hypothetical protein
LTVGLDVMLGSFGRMVRGMRMMTVRGVSVVTRFFVISSFVVLGSFSVVAGGVLVMLSSLMMMLCGFVGH